MGRTAASSPSGPSRLSLLGGGPADFSGNRPLSLLAAWGGLADFPANRPLSSLGLLGLLGAVGPRFQQIVR